MQYSELLTQRVNSNFRNGIIIPCWSAGLDLLGVAKAAVAGDEQALDMFANLDMFSWRPKTAGRRPIIYPSEFRDSMAFFAAAESGRTFLFFYL